MGKLVTVKPFYTTKRVALAELTSVVVKMMWKLGMGFDPNGFLVFSQTEPSSVRVSMNDYYKEGSESSKHIFTVDTLCGFCFTENNSFPSSLSKKDLKIFNKCIEALLKDSESGKSIEELTGKEIDYWVLSPLSLEFYFKDKTKYIETGYCDGNY